MAREVADTSKKATARARVRRMINSCNDSLQTIYQEIGSRYYVENQCQPEEQYEGLFQQASDLIAQIDVLKSELAGLDNASICPECGSKVNDGQKFCPECGHKNAVLWQSGKLRQRQQRLLAVRQRKQSRQNGKPARRRSLRLLPMRPQRNRFPMRQKKMFFRQMRQRVTEKMHSNLVRLHSGRRMPFRAECVLRKAGVHGQCVPAFLDEKPADLHMPAGVKEYIS